MGQLCALVITGMSRVFDMWCWVLLLVEAACGDVSSLQHVMLNLPAPGSDDARPIAFGTSSW